MRWGIYSRDGFEGALAFREGLLSVGQEAQCRSVSDFSAGCFESFDVAVVWGLQGRGRDVLIRYAAAGIPVLVVDYGYMRRTNHAHDWRVGHWQVSLDGLNRPPRCEVDSSRFDALSLEVAERGGDPHGYVLLCAQTTGDASHGMDEAGLQDWCDDQVKQWPDLLIRPHPLQSHLDYGLPRCEAATLEQALRGARLVVTANSNSGHEALMSGVPAIATRPGAVWDSLSGIELPSRDARLAHCHRCAWGQWTWAEFRAGTAQQFLIEKVLQ